jgi:hypothetical protein
MIEANVDGHEGFSGEKPLTTPDPERLRACFTERLKQTVVSTRFSLRSLYENP